MAVRFSADGQDYTSSITSTTPGTCTFCCWVNTAVDRNAASTALALDSSSSNGMQIRTGADGTTFNYYDQTTSTASVVSQTVGTWYFLAVIRDGTDISFYYPRYDTPLITTNKVTVSGAASSVTINTVRIGESATGSQWYNGSVQGVRFWNSLLSEEELQAEMLQLVPQRSNNLICWFPLSSTADTRDGSRNGYTLSGGSGAANAEGPPIRWRSRTRILSAVVPLRTTDFADTFSAGTINTAIWDANYGSPDISLGRARIPAVNADYQAIATSGRYTLGDLWAQCTPPASGGGATVAYLAMVVSSSTAGTNLTIVADPVGNYIAFKNNVSYADAGETVITYDSTAHKWWRMCMDGTSSMLMQTSPDGTTWTTRRTLTPPAWVANTNLSVSFEAHREGGTNDYAYVDNVNSPPGNQFSVGFTRAIETDTGRTITPVKSVTVAQAVETDTATAVVVDQSTPPQSITVTQAVETDTATAVTIDRSITVTQAVETDTATAVTIGKSITITQAVETDTATAITRATDRTFSKTDAVAVTDSITVARVQTKTIVDGAGAIDAVNAAVDRRGSNSETAATADTVTAAAHRPRTSTDAAGAVDVAQTSRGKNITESAAAADAAVTAAQRLRAPTDAAGTVDAATITRGKTFADSTGLADTVEAVSHSQRPLADSVAAADALTPEAARPRTTADQAAAGDVSVCALGRARQPADQGALTDGISITKNQHLDLTAAAGATDAITVNVASAGAQILVDSAATTDAIGLTRDRTIAAGTDSAGATDALLAAKAGAATAADPVAATDTVALAASAIRAASDGVGVSDAISVQFSAAGAVAIPDQAGVADAVTVATHRRAAAGDSAAATDAVGKSVGRIRSIDDSAGISDSAAVSMVGVVQRYVDDSLDISDSVTVVHSAAGQVNVADQVGLGDAAQAEAARAWVLAEAAGIVDGVSVDWVINELYAGPAGIVDTTIVSTVTGPAAALVTAARRPDLITDTTAVSDIDAGPVATIERTV